MPKPVDWLSDRDLLNVIHRLNGVLGLILGLEANETKATATSGVAVLNNDLAT